MTIPLLSSYPLPGPGEFPRNNVDWTFTPERAVLLVHDMQEYFVHFYGEGSALIGEIVDNIGRLRAACKARGVPVVYTAQPNHQSADDRGLLNDMWGPGLNRHPDQQAVVAALAPAPDDTVLVKWRYSAFQRSPLEAMMREWGRDQLAICGIYGHIGCLTTALDAFMRDIKPFMVGDAIGDFSREDHLMTLRHVAGRCGRVVATADLSPTDLAPTDLDRNGLRARLLAALELSDDQFDPDENLIDYGLDSVTVMALVAEWRRSGIEIDFADLARRPSLNGWWSLIEERRPAAGGRG